MGRVNLAGTLTAAVGLAAAFGVGLADAPRAAAAPPLIEGLGQYRVLDASGRVAPMVPTDAAGRIALRPAVAPGVLLRGRPIYLSGYAGQTYDRNPATAAPVPTGYYGRPHPGGLFGRFWHGR